MEILSFLLEDLPIRVVKGKTLLSSLQTRAKMRNGHSAKRYGQPATLYPPLTGPKGQIRTERTFS